MNEIKLWHVANAGVILEMGEVNIGVDILCDQIEPFMETPEEVEKQVMDRVCSPLLDYLIITHEHGDHYSKRKITKFLGRQPRVKVISNESVISDLCGLLDESRRIVVRAGENAEIALRDKDFTLQVFHSTHMGSEYKDTMNLSVVLSWHGKNILIPGDAEPRQLLTGTRLSGHKLDFLIVPFPYISLVSVRKLVKDKIKPEGVFILHLPASEFDTEEWIPRSKEIYHKEAGSFPETWFGEYLGARYQWQLKTR